MKKSSANLYLFWGVLPLIAVVYAFVHFSEFAIHAVNQNTVLNGIIIGAAIIAAIITLWRIIQYNAEFSAIQMFDRGVKAGRDMRQMVAHPTVRKTQSARVLARIAGTDGKVNSRVEQSAIQEEFHIVKQTFEGRQELSQYLVGLMVAFGLLGTFIGLLETLVKVSDLIGGFANADMNNMDVAFKTLVDKLRSPLVAMGTAFSASMFGLIGSLMLGLMFIALRNATSAYFNYAHDAFHRLTEVVNSAIPQKLPLSNSSDSTLASLVKHFGIPMSYTKTLGEQMTKLNGVLEMQQKMMASQTAAGQGMNRALSWLTDEDKKRLPGSDQPIDQMRRTLKAMLQEVKDLTKKHHEGPDAPALLYGMGIVESVLKLQRLSQNVHNLSSHFTGMDIDLLRSFYQSLGGHRDIMLMLVDRVRTAELDSAMPLDEKENLKADFIKATERVIGQVQFDSSRVIPEITSVLTNYSDKPLDIVAV